MRTLNKNKQPLYYALLSGINAEVSETESIVVDGVTVPLDYGDFENTYQKPVKFMANISFSGGDSVNLEFGVDSSAYDAIIVTDLGSIPITETSLIWYETEPIMAESDGSNADYSVVAIRKSLNQFKAILKKRVK